MIYFLFFSVILLAIIYLKLFSLDVASPSFLATLMFVLSIFINVWRADSWGTDYSLTAFAVIMVGLLSLGLGELFERSLSQNRISYSSYSNGIETDKHPLQMDKGVYFVLLFFALIILALDFVATYRLSLLGGLGPMLSSARHAIVGEDIRKGAILTRMLGLNKASAYISIYLILYNRLICKAKNNKKYAIFILIFLGDSVLSTGRNAFLRMISYTLILFFVLYLKEHRLSWNTVFRLGKYGFVGLFAFFGIFTIVGHLSGKGIYNTPIEIISYYMGSSINLLNQYIVDPGKSASSFFGEHTLYGVYNILRIIGFDIPQMLQPLEFRYVPHYEPNIYTAFRRYIQDFGFLGLFFIMFFLGLFYARLRIRAANDKTNGWKTIFFSLSMYPIVEIAIEERFFMDYVTVTTFINILWMLIIYKIVTSNISIVFGKRHG